MARLSSTLLVLGCGAALLAPSAQAKTTLSIKGAGFGHGVGMSQYGAYGFALKGTRYPEILAHYYTGTRLGTLTTSPTVTVLLRSSKSAAFTGASSLGGRKLNARRSYSVLERGGAVVLRSATGRTLATYYGTVRTGAGSRPQQLMGPGPNSVRDGRFRGALEFRPASGRLLVINAVGLDSYVRGVVAAESPASWPQDALRAQAVAARTYAITTNAGSGQGFMQWPDTRSQVYNGVSAETPTTDAAVAATSRQVVTYEGKPIVTYFFSTSGGRTENVENGFPGAEPKPYLKSVEDPYDDASPKHRWGPLRFSQRQAEQRLRGLVKGRFRAVKVTERGVSPRIVSARVVGTRGSTTVSGATLRARFDLFDSWATFTTISSKVGTTKRPTSGGASARAARDRSLDRSLWAATLAAAARPPYGAVLSGRVEGARRGSRIRVQRRTTFGWANAFWTSARNAKGRYRAGLPEPGVYRVRWRGQTGPEVEAR